MNTDLPAWLSLVGLVSFLCFLAALLALPWVIGSLPADIFMGRSRKEPSHPVPKILLLLLRNIAGALLFVMGFVMLFIPGQGLLTMLAGLVLMSFPGKTYLVHRLLSLKTLQRGLNGLRKKLKKRPFLFPEIGSERAELD